jgi:branched-chain amino acid transport system permease protein
VLSIIGVGFVLLLLAWLAVNLIKTPTDFFNVLLIGITTGSVYALVALGYTLVYGILQLINFAHGDVFALSGLFASTIILSVFSLSEATSTLGIIGGLAATFVIAGAFGAIVNSTIEFIAYRRLRHAPRLAVLITAVGMSFIVQNISLAIYSVNFKSIPPLISDHYLFSFRGVHYDWASLFVLLVTIPVLVFLSWVVKATKQGKAMRATSQDREASAIMGINVNRTITFTFALAGALAGIGATLFLVEFNVRYDTGFELGLIAFTAAVLGGIGNLTGAVLGALCIGLIQAFNEGLSWNAPGSDWTRSIVFAILIAILVFRPEGLLGERTPEGAWWPHADTGPGSRCATTGDSSRGAPVSTASRRLGNGCRAPSGRTCRQPP